MIKNVWLKLIKNDIYKKYKISNPRFIVDPAAIQGYTLESWLENIVDLKDYWLKYKRVDKSTFELKSFHCDPDEKLIFEIINKFIDELLTKNKINYFTINKYIYIEKPSGFSYELNSLPGETFYTLPEIKIELRFLLRKGYSKIGLEKISKVKKQFVARLKVDSDTLPNMIKSGYLQLEYFD